MRQSEDLPVFVVFLKLAFELFDFASDVDGGLGSLPTVMPIRSSETFVGFEHVNKIMSSVRWKKIWLNMEDGSRYGLDQAERLILMRIYSIAVVMSLLVYGGVWVSSRRVP